MSISEIVKARGITEVIHFTTNHGMLGILVTNALLPNSKLKEEDTLAFIFKQNSETRKEKNRKWLDYVNLSISKLNQSFYDYSEYRHRAQEMFWVILSFSPDILEHEGVYFATTNNIYPSCKRGIGAEALEFMFADPVEGFYQNLFYRNEEHKDSWTTCEQAEVLYPDSLALDYLNHIYVKDEISKHGVKAQMSALNYKELSVIVAPEKFKTS
ncbi:DarT ssDNA thymidine ADP-ribosyltransferase family protein [Vibrio sp. 11-4(1)]|uniref:DarT ssDNA thymidine ADP-ribosyltransferase family protein n=1 Tax=Vibrio sp. 11-4(1) TaxID=2591018 RepID=UPI001482BA3A|nr:DUF4433 domain-containing protein [Vibrio sp. 11-4(1)]